MAGGSRGQGPLTELTVVSPEILSVMHTLILEVSATWNPFHWSTASYLIAIAALLGLHHLLPRDGRWYVRLGREMLIIAPAVFLYFAVRGVVSAREADAIRNAENIMRFQDRIGILREQSLQERIVESDMLVRIVNWVYIWGHWPVVVGTLVWLIIWRPRTYSVYRNAFLISGILAMFVFAMFPVAPPRLMPELAVVDTVTEQSGSYRVLQPPALTNPFAAMPSLHFGWNLLMGIAIVRESRIAIARWFGYFIPIAMFSAIVLTANHYFLDGLAGGTLVLGSLWLSTFILRKRGSALGVPDPDPGEGAMHAEFRDLRHADQQRHPLAGIPIPVTIAHRAGNSIGQARAAESAGIDVVEADLWLHRGRLEVRHSKTLGPIPIRWDRWSLETTVDPCLELTELLHALKPDTRVMLDLKGSNPELPPRLLDVMRRERAGHQILVCSQSWGLLESLRREPDVSLVYSIGSRRRLTAAWRLLDGGDVEAVSIHMRLLDEEIVRRLKEYVSWVITWPVNTSEQLLRLEGLGVTGVISDNPSLLASIVRTRDPGDSEDLEPGTSGGDPPEIPAAGSGQE